MDFIIFTFSAPPVSLTFYFPTSLNFLLFFLHSLSLSLAYFLCLSFFTLSFLTTSPLLCDTIPPRFLLSLWPQQQQLQHLSHHAPGIPLTPHPSGLSLGAGGSGLLALTGALGVSAHLASKDERNHLDPEHLRGKGLLTLVLFQR